MARRDPVSEEDRKKVTAAGLKHAWRMLAYMKPYRSYFVAGMVLLVFSSLTALVFPFVTGRLVDSATGALKGYDRNTIALSLIGILVLQGIFSFTRVWLMARVSDNTMRDIRTAVFSRIISLPMPFYEQRRVGELTSRLTADVGQLYDVLSFTLAEFLRQIITLVVGISIISITSGRLTLVMLCSFPLLVVGAMVFGRYIRKLSKQTQDDLAAANVIAEESLQGIQVVKAFTNEHYEVVRYNTALGRVLANSLRTAQYRGTFFSFVIFSIFGGIVLVLWYGLGLVAEGQITIGSLVSFIIYTTFIGGSVGGIGDLYGQLQKTVGASERLSEILGEEPELDPSTATPHTRLKGAISFQDIVFSYPSRPDVNVLHGLSFQVEPGQTVALVGASGAGKSTVFQLLLRHYIHQQGQIAVDAMPTDQLDLRLLRANIGVVPQEVMLFGGTIAENIAYGRPGATQAEIEEAAKQAYAYDFIMAFPDGFGTVVGERGIKLSGGQRQRIAIARALLKDPAILLLDEATSSLDAESEALVQAALDKLMLGRTTIVIAHRLSTIRQVNRIYVMDQGRVVQQGTHDELMQLPDSIYVNLVRLQFGQAEEA